MVLCLIVGGCSLLLIIPLASICGLLVILDAIPGLIDHYVVQCCKYIVVRVVRYRRFLVIGVVSLLPLTAALVVETLDAFISSLFGARNGVDLARPFF